MNASAIRWMAWTAAWLVATGTALGSEEAAAEHPSLFTGDLGNILWSLITFGVVLVVLGKFAWKPVLGALQKREAFIRESLEQARKDREEAQAQLREYAAKIEAAKTEATAIVEEGRRDAEAVKRQIEENARQQASAMIERAKREIGIATDTAVKELYTLSGRLATEVASRIIHKELSPQDHERLVAESIEELARVNGRSGTARIEA